MLSDLYKSSWTRGMKLDKIDECAENNVKQLGEMVKLAKLCCCSP
jgi:CheY-specific phosphatase CheX